MPPEPKERDGQHTPSDGQLVRTVLYGAPRRSDQAYEMLVKRYEGIIRAFLRHVCGRAAVADELAQETFLTGWQKLSTLRDPERFAGWLRQLAYRQFLHSHRRRMLEQKHAASQVTDREPVSRDHAAIPVEIERLLAPCSPLEQELIVLVYGFGFTVAEIAAARDMAAGTVKSTLHRARLRIYDKLDPPIQPAHSTQRN